MCATKGYLTKRSDLETDLVKAYDTMLDEDDPMKDSKGCFKQIADLQALDFLCGNVDRHDGNFSFQISKDRPPRVLGIKGFDNDTSFGDLIPTRT